MTITKHWGLEGGTPSANGQLSEITFMFTTEVSYHNQATSQECHKGQGAYIRMETSQQWKQQMMSQAQANFRLINLFIHFDFLAHFTRKTRSDCLRL